MKVKRVRAAYFSPVKNTEKLVLAAAVSAAETLGISEVSLLDFTNPKEREVQRNFDSSDLVILGTPTYAGRVPNKIMPFIKEKLAGGGAPGAALVTYGNRSFDDSLMELGQLMKDGGFTLLGGGAFVCEHAFAHKLAAGRPDGADVSMAEDFGRKLAEKVLAGNLTTPEFPGNNPVGPYYVPKGTDGQPAVFLKAKPVTDQLRCSGCGLCAERCPMGSIRAEDNFEVSGICIKCQACVVSCPMDAKYFTDEAFLSHKAMLEETFADEGKENQVYL